MIDATDPGIIGARDRALILLGFAGAFSRSELVRLDVEDCTFSKDGLTVALRRSKVDQVGDPTGPIPRRARSARPVVGGRGGRDGRAVVPVSKPPWAGTAGEVERHRRGARHQETGARADLDAAKYAGHSLRAGHATSAAIAGASERSIMEQTGHRSVQMVRRYIRDGSLFRENSAGKLGL